MKSSYFINGFKPQNNFNINKLKTKETYKQLEMRQFIHTQNHIVHGK